MKRSKWLTILGREEIFVCGSNRRRALDGCFREEEEEEEEEDITQDLPEDFNFWLAMCSQMGYIKN